MFEISGIKDINGIGAMGFGKRGSGGGGGNVPILQDFNDGAYNTFLMVYDTRFRGQSFTPSIDQTITSFKINCWKVGAPVNPTVKIYAADVNHFPTGSVLASKVLTSADLFDYNSGGTLTEWTFDVPVGLTAGVEYVVVLEVTGGSSSTNQVRISASLDVYAGFTIYSANSGVSWSTLAYDFIFESWGY